MSDSDKTDGAELSSKSQADDAGKSPRNTIEQARIFLQDAHVLEASREKKIEFLQSKGFDEQIITELLGQATDVQTNEPGQDRPTSQATNDSPSEQQQADRPPIVTYPEFMTKSTRSPPLMTMNGFLNTLYAFGSLSTLVYGTSKYVLEPMVDSLTEARVDLYDTAGQNLTKLVEKLEGAVTEIPPTIIKKPDLLADVDGVSNSSYDDPTELFHRDIGVQTSLPPSPDPSQSRPNIDHHQQQQPAIAYQSGRIRDLVTSVRLLTDEFVTQSDDYADISTVLDVFKNDLDQMTYRSPADFIGGYSLYGNAVGRNEPNDEIKSVKENIRRVKGVLLSARSFPGSR